MAKNKPNTLGGLGLGHKIEKADQNNFLHELRVSTFGICSEECEQKQNEHLPFGEAAEQLELGIDHLTSSGVELSQTQWAESVLGELENKYPTLQIEFIPAVGSSMEKFHGIGGYFLFKDDSKQSDYSLKEVRIGVNFLKQGDQKARLFFATPNEPNAQVVAHNLIDIYEKFKATGEWGNPRVLIPKEHLSLRKSVESVFEVRTL